ncbi:MAG: hypothetical protein COZ18_05645 [Flexibacter sp. CG_4_10_14_3_um_filter_32_15]|nr:MAG: hypothetical protein COZ18_05645 [Flexibacter sp. CG_4_10_14_3_um_filter_32_15]
MSYQLFLEKLGFTTQNEILYKKKYLLQNYTIRVDIDTKKIFYRLDNQTTIERQNDNQIQLGDKTTSNLNHAENYVVLECVNRLLEKGYEPNDIHLERRYPSGRGASGGKSDICVYGKDTKSLLVIECKTWGAEFEREKIKMNEHGGQLFAYLANDQNAKFLVLYTSKLNEKEQINDNFEYENLIVQIKDREEDLIKPLKQIEEEDLKLYRDAKNKNEFFEVWKDTFIKYVHFNGVFDEDANPYSLELKALKKKNLKSIEDATGLFNKFAEILRHNNISDNSNAFNKILSLFLCKIVDEEKNDEEILDFQVREDEHYEHIIDRLQALYQIGMKKLNEEVIYYSEKELQDIIRLYPAQTPIQKVEEIFRELKYYTHNEFAFKEVHNKKLFIQNGKVLREVIKLIQNFRFRFSNKQAVLGDFFELMLNHGVKQSEGQFFTPIPIVRYIILSLGYENIIQNKIKEGKEKILPKVLDYACGAGHFLTESVEEIQAIIKRMDTSTLSLELQKKIEIYKKGTEWAENFIYGIEKDYRLARASQIACYINGDGDANIIFGDGLEDNEKLKLEENKFDIVVANPPYSVDAFKNYLNVGKSHFELFDSLTENSNEIETLFIERTKQVLNYDGVAGIVLPTSIFESGGIYTKAREILLKYFEIKGITILGSKTFIATNVKTLIIFLKRRNDDFLEDRQQIASHLFSNLEHKKEFSYLDAEKLLTLFVEYRDFDLKEYKLFLKTEISDELLQTEMFLEYKIAFDNLAETKKLKTTTSFKKHSENEKIEKINSKFYLFCKEKEQEKFLYFMLCLSDASKNPQIIEKYYDFQQTVVVKTGKTTTEQTETLGYEFSTRKGQEGIKINKYGGKLFDEENILNPKKASSYIYKSILNEEIKTINEEIKEHVQLFNLVELIDFDQTDFDKKISTETVTKTSWEEIWQSENITILDSVAHIQKGSSITKAKTIEGKIPVIAGGQQPAYFHNVSNRSENCITISASGAYAGFLNFWDTEIFASDCTTVQSLNENKISTKLLYEILKVVQSELYKLQRGQAQPHVYPRDIQKIKIPIPTKNQQILILEDLTKLETERGNYLSKGVSVSELDAILQEQKKKIIEKHCFDR